MSTKVREFLSTSRGKVATAITSSAVILATALPLSASADEVTTPVTSFPITADMLSGVTEGFNSAVAIAVPVGVAIMAVMIGIGFVPKLIKKFTKG